MGSPGKQSTWRLHSPSKSPASVPAQPSCLRLDKSPPASWLSHPSWWEFSHCLPNPAYAKLRGRGGVHSLTGETESRASCLQLASPPSGGLCSPWVLCAWKTVPCPVPPLQMPPPSGEPSWVSRQSPSLPCGSTFPCFAHVPWGWVHTVCLSFQPLSPLVASFPGRGCGGLVLGSPLAFPLGSWKLTSSPILVVTEVWAQHISFLLVLPLAHL